MDWSPAKQQVFRFESDIVVSAGAGSGKTAALVELYLRLLAGETSLPEPLAADEIVAITFTDKAAVEMRERVRTAVGTRLAAGDTATDWKKVLASLSAAPIATFHSFCAAILRENPAEAGVDPAFTLLDDLDSNAELQGALDEVIEGELTARTPEIRRLLHNFPLSGTGRGKGLREHLAYLHRQLAGSGSDAAFLAEREKAWEEEAVGLFREKCAELRELMGEVARILAGKPLGFHGKLRELPELYGQGHLDLDDPQTPLFLDAMCSCIAGGWGKEKPARDGLVACLDALSLAAWQRQSAPLVAALIALAGKLATAYRLRKERRAALDFDDLQLKVRDLLRDDAALRAEYRQRCRVVMVDEFQDTNPLQKELVGLLCGEEQRLFIVGDPKQSIYLFRGAAVEVFAHAQAEMAAHGGENLYFQESFRSREGIIAFVNALFTGVMGTGDQGPGTGNPDPSGRKGLGTANRDFEVRYGAGDHLEPRRRDWDGTPCVELLTLEAEGKAEQLRSIEAAALARKIQRLVSGEEDVVVFDKTTGTRDSGLGTGNDPELLGSKQELPPPGAAFNGGCGLYESRVPSPEYVPRRPRYGDIAILFRRFTHLKTFEQELRRAGIPYYVVKGKGFYRCQEVRDILNFLTWLEYGGDLTALVGVLRSPLCGVSDETLFLLSRLDGGLRAWERWFVRFPVPGPLGPLFGSQSPSLERIDPADRERLALLARLVARLRPLRDRLTLAEILEEILAGTDFASSLLATFQGGQKVANLRKLIELSRSFDRPGEGSLRGFVNYLAELVEGEPTEAEAVISAEGEDVVRLMTVHQSKGLEFPVVFVPELGAGTPVATAPVQYDPALGLGMKQALPAVGWGTPLAHERIARLRREKEAAELKRLFYVAVTRARDYLVLSGEGKGEWRRWMDEFRDGEAGHLLRVSSAGELRAADAGASFPVADEPGAPLPDPKLLALAARRSLDHAPPLPTSMTFSPTALEDYRHCPRKYFFKAVMGLDEGLFADLLGARAGGKKGGSRLGMSPVDKGNLAHFLLESLDFAAAPQARRNECMRLAPLAVSDPDGGGTAEVIDRVLAFVASPTGRELAAKRLLREHPFILGFRGKADYYLRGAMDLVVVDEETATVYDYKYLARDDTDLDGYRFQLRTYMLALARVWPEKRVDGRLVFLNSGREEAVTCDAAPFAGELLRIMDAIRERSAEEEFLLRAGCDGRHCPFRERCRAGKTQS